MDKSSRVKAIVKSALSGSKEYGVEVISVKTADLEGVKELSVKVTINSEIHTVIIQKTMFLFVPTYSVLVKSSSGKIERDYFASFSLGQDFNRQYGGHVSRIDISSKCLRQIELRKIA